jgi:hypothetical protein
MLKLYLFNGVYEWDTEHAAGIIAETKEEAEKIYRVKKVIKDNDFNIKEISIVKGLYIKPFGHDYICISAKC